MLEREYKRLNLWRCDDWREGCDFDHKELAFITILLTYILIVFGGYVASSQSAR